VCLGGSLHPRNKEFWENMRMEFFDMDALLKNWNTANIEVQ